MLAAVKGYYDGKQIVMNEEDRKQIITGQEVIVTLLEYPTRQDILEDLENDRFVIPTERGKNVDEYMKGMRENDRF